MAKVFTFAHVGWNTWVSPKCFSLNSLNSMTKSICHFSKGFEHTTSCIWGQDATTELPRHVWESRSFNWPQFMLQWLIRFPGFVEFTEFPFYLGKTPLCKWECHTCTTYKTEKTEIINVIASFTSKIEVTCQSSDRERVEETVFFCYSNKKSSQDRVSSHFLRTLPKATFSFEFNDSLNWQKKMCLISVNWIGAVVLETMGVLKGWTIYEETFAIASKTCLNVQDQL